MSTPRRALALVAFAGIAVAAPAARAQSNDPSFRITNNSASEINEIYVSSSGVNSWGPDRLGDRTLASGTTYTLRLPAGQCMNDVRVVFADGQSTERRRQNTCGITDMVFP